VGLPHAQKPVGAPLQVHRGEAIARVLFTVDGPAMVLLHGFARSLRTRWWSI